MENYKAEFIELAMRTGVLKLGQYELKSGRISPYFFNSGLFNTGLSAANLGRHYAQAAIESGINFDMLFGPAYKGIPLVTLAAASLADDHEKDFPFAFNRKEAKAHGEGGSLVGAPLEGKVLIIDDVITAGTAIREVMGIVEQAGAKAAGVVIGLDRKERGKTDKSAIQEVEEQFGIPVASIVDIDDILGYLEKQPENQDLVAKIDAYRQQYGV